jgi:hypothetical protein
MHRHQQQYSTPEELHYVDIQGRRGARTAEVLYPDLLKAVDWLVSKGYADSRLKATLRKGCPVPSDWRPLSAIVELRRTAANVVMLADTIIYSTTESEKAAALRMLPNRIRALQFRAARCLTALDTEG